MAKPVLTIELIKQIAADRRSRISYADLSAKYQVAEGTIRNALIRFNKSELERAQVGAQVVHVPSENAAEPAAPPTRDDLARFLADQVASLTRDAERLRGQGDTAALAACNRNLIAAHTLLAKVTPEPEPKEDPDESPDMVKLGEQVWERFTKFLDAWQPDGSSCPHCGRK